jgi:hypothetical protein
MKSMTLLFLPRLFTWYSMSSVMKVFFDSLSDLLETEKDLRRKLRGKNMAAIGCSIGNHIGDAFWMPFS